MKKTTIIKLLIPVFLGALFFCIFFCFTFESSTNEELSEFQKIAEEVYVQNDTLIETPENIVIEKTPHYILVKEDNENSYGYVKATLKNGELSFEKKDGMGDRIGSTVTVTVLLTIFLSAGFITMINKVES